MVEKLYFNGRERYRLVCDTCGKSALVGAYRTEAKMRQAVKSAGIKLDFSASWRCEKCTEVCGHVLNVMKVGGGGVNRRMEATLRGVGRA